MKLVIFIGTVASVLIVGAVYLFKPTVFSFIPNIAPASEKPVIRSSGRPVPAGQKEYYNPTYKFSLLYPETLSVEEFNEGGGAITITFENIEESKGFQIFIVPFYEESISEDRFKADIPSGVRKDMKDVSIDGAVGAVFYSEDQVLGETAEVWFLRNKLLYEVNSFKGLEVWLSDIMATWKFVP